MSQESEKRLNKFISDSGYCSRREADKLIEQSRVKINGQVPELGTKVQPGDEVFVDGKRINKIAANKSDRIYIAYNKPTGITCTTERNVYGNIIDAIKHKERIFPIGRLDKPSEGLIFLTSDGDIVNKILRAENAHDKEYRVSVDQPLSERFVDRMQRGVPILDTITKPCIVKVESRFVFTIILTQGLNRQIRRMCEYLGYEVTRLQRTRIMNVTLDNLKAGQWRNLSDKEMLEINTAVAGSSKTAVNTAQPKAQQTANNSISHQTNNHSNKNNAKLSRQKQAADASPYYGKAGEKSTPKAKKVFVNKNAKTSTSNKGKSPLSLKPKLSLKRK
ncbi:23S rRNA pseudouridine(2604) synthase RluF [Psychromonas algicola]|uniref:23S rRNA pseudouridine(2604) synthase RluF n=1 Tax=Psychromonas algicola TaxID=2555642 RepID=UPI001068354E|nr:23S rRNA pseudouridine(2604) synthase RluF [Psychromonas sp. RZ5]TEW49857.1 23S rRNA pseudouridine(2604) synthase RluF [Psychromonas sp. RZ5]